MEGTYNDDLIQLPERQKKRHPPSVNIIIKQLDYYELPCMLLYIKIQVFWIVALVLHILRGLQSSANSEGKK